MKDNSASSNDISQWKGKDITNFQDSLLNKVKTQVSEKWFYTYFKNDNLTKIPRIDMLNILSEYAGFKDWATFKAAILSVEQSIENKENDTINFEINNNLKELPLVKENIDFSEIKETKAIVQTKKTVDFIFLKKYKIALFYVFFSTLLIMLLFLFEVLPLKYNYEFCFTDSDRNKPITTPLEITLLQEGESPLHYKADANGCFSIKLKDNKIKLVVNSPYYKKDTIYRVIKSKYHSERVALKTDDYALMLYYFAHSKVEDWKKRRKELRKMIANNAIIYQVFGNESYGVDILSKEDFINKLTLPTSSLKNLNVIETEKKNNKIIKLKFEVIPDEN
ncbi:MAG: hypothetical protein ACEQSF_05140 [Solirubrobacteraceae bacterium]